MFVMTIKGFFMFMPTNELNINYMQRTIALAKKGGGFVHPNPLVGCVVVKNGEVIAEGYHEHYGGFHAERNALNACTTDPKGATLYVTLEPCCHEGKTPPCTDIIIEKGIRKVVVGILDSNPIVSGKGVKKLQDAGIEVVTGIEENSIKELNKVFLKFIKTRQPYVLMKYAMTMDGKIASCSGDSKWITCEASRQVVHTLRSEMMGIVVGRGTVAADDPMLNCRLDGQPHQPIRIVIDGKASLSPASRLAQTAKEYHTIVAHTDAAKPERLNALQEKGVETVCCLAKDGRVDICDFINRMGAQGIDSLLLEGGASLNASFLEAGCVDEVYAFIAPKIIGGSGAPSPVSGKGFQMMSEAIALEHLSVENTGCDLLMKGKIPCLQES